jgi:hypothetical protein
MQGTESVMPNVNRHRLITQQQLQVEMLKARGDAPLKKVV